MIVEKPFKETIVAEGSNVDPSRDNRLHLANTLKHSDVIVNVASTIAIEAAIMDTPVVNIAFDGHDESRSWTRRAASTSTPTTSRWSISAPCGSPRRRPRWSKRSPPTWPIPLVTALAASAPRRSCATRWTAAPPSGWPSFVLDRLARLRDRAWQHPHPDPRPAPWGPWIPMAPQGGRGVAGLPSPAAGRGAGGGALRPRKVTVVDSQARFAPSALLQLWQYRELVTPDPARDQGPLPPVAARDGLGDRPAAGVHGRLQPGVLARFARLPSDGLPYPIFSYTALVPWTFLRTR